MLLAECGASRTTVYQLTRRNVFSSTVAAALPAIDCGAPPARPHVALKLKRWQRERERTARLARDNRALLQRLAAIMAARRLDNRWTAPLPNFQQKVGLFYDAESLNSKLTARSLAAEEAADTSTNVKCYACEIKKKQYNYSASKPRQRQNDSLPSIYSN